MSKISELEGVVLGIVGTHSRCTAYQVRRELQASPSTHWSGSAGAIYPLLTRLVASRHVASALDTSDGRGRSLLSLTAKGRRALRAWILTASQPTVAAAIFDAVRSRVFFLQSLSPRDRARFAAAALDALEGFLTKTLEFERNRKDVATPFEQMAARGAILTGRARVEWMREVEVSLGRAANPAPSRLA